MKSNRTTNGSARRGFISTQAAIVLAVVTGSAGLARSVLSDESGPVAYGAQSLLVTPRPSR